MTDADLPEDLPEDVPEELREADEADDGEAPRGHFLQRLAAGGGSAGAAIGAGMAEFNAFMGQGRAWQDEKESRALRREEDAEGEPPRFEIDLDAGTARYRPPRPPRPRPGEGHPAG